MSSPTSTISTTPTSTSTAPSSLPSPSSGKGALSILPLSPKPDQIASPSSLIASFPIPPSSQARDPLTSLPPELLLAIISHLPTSAHLLPLSQTSTYLQSFILLTHASTICNTLIRRYHTLCSSILHSTISSSGWLLPTHHSVTGTETKLIREKVMKTGCVCAGCREFLHSSRSSSTSTSSELSLTDLETKRGIFSCLPSPPAPASPTCKAQHVLNSPWKLTMPGPLFLVFLERYEWELETRYAMLQAECAGDADTLKKEEEERRFSFIVGNYSVRRFLGDVERDFGGGVEGNDEVPQIGADKIGLRAKMIMGAGKAWRSTKISSSLKGLKMKKKKKTEGARTESQGSKRPMFGEISHPPDTVVEKQDGSWMKGLLWYYGIQTPLSSSEAPTLAIPGEEKQQRKERSEGAGDGEGEKKMVRGCMAGVKCGARNIGGKLKLVFRKCTFSGSFSFQALDG